MVDNEDQLTAKEWRQLRLEQVLLTALDEELKRRAMKTDTTPNG